MPEARLKKTRDAYSECNHNISKVTLTCIHCGKSMDQLNFRNHGRTLKEPEGARSKSDE
jgi:hypothetical protein